MNGQAQEWKVALGAALLTLGMGLTGAGPAHAGEDALTAARRTAEQATNSGAEYANANVAGVPLVVLPGEIKSNNASFRQRIGPNNIADYAELELTRANFSVLDRNQLGAAMREFQLAYTMGDANAARKQLQKGKLKTTRWIVKFDILKAEQVAAAKKGFDGRALGGLLGVLGGRSGDHGVATAAMAGQAVSNSVKNEDEAAIWNVGLRYTILDANTTEQKASGYFEDKLEVGAQSSSVMGASEGSAQVMTLDSLVQRLVQKAVSDIDRKYKG